MPPLTELLIGGVLPGVLSLVLLGLPWLLWRADRADRRGAALSSWIAPVAMAIAFVPATLITNKHATLWPVNASERGLAVVGVALLMALLGLLARETLRRKPAVAATTATCMAAMGSAFAAFALLKPLHPHAVPTPLYVGLVVGAGAWVAFATLTLGAASKARPGAVVPGLVSIGLFGASLVMLFSAIGVFAQATGGLVAAMTSATLIGLWKRSHALNPAAFVVPLTVLAYFLLGAWQLSNTPPLGAIAMIAAMPFVMGAIARFVVKKARTSLVVGAILAALYIGGAAGWGYSIYAASQSDSAYGY